MSGCEGAGAGGFQPSNWLLARCARARAGLTGRRGSADVCGADGGVGGGAGGVCTMWEEPPISGQRGSGTIFFSHCPLRCVYCQNQVIAVGQAGVEVSVERVADMCLNLQGQGALNINFVTPTHYAPQARAAVALARQRGLALPVVWNTSGYETAQAVRDNVGTVDVYLTDLKYMSSDLAKRYSSAPGLSRGCLGGA